MTDNEQEKTKILIVDDKPANLDVLFEFLKGTGFKTLVATSGEMALRQLENIKPDLILLDVMMPVLNGFETCKRIKENNNTKNIPVFFMTALTEIADKVKGFEVGAVDYITKPIQQEELLARITKELTIQKQNKQLIELNKQLEISNIAKDKLFSIIAHDLKNAFSPLLASSDLLKKAIKESKTDKIIDFSSRISSSAINAYKLLENLLNWSKMQIGKTQLQPKSFKLNFNILKTISLFVESCKQKQIELDYNMDDSIMVYADPNMVDTIIRNLLSNAIKFTSPNGKIEISVKSKDDYALICVSDNGIGIEQDKLKNIFDIASDYKEIGTIGEKGTGLGLNLCKYLVERNKGKIWVESLRDQGTSFYFTICKDNNENQNKFNI